MINQGISLQSEGQSSWAVSAAETRPSIATGTRNNHRKICRIDRDSQGIRFKVNGICSKSQFSALGPAQNLPLVSGWEYVGPKEDTLGYISTSLTGRLAVLWLAVER